MIIRSIINLVFHLRQHQNLDIKLMWDLRILILFAWLLIILQESSKYQILEHLEIIIIISLIIDRMNQFSEASKFNQQLRKQMRKKDIHRRLAQRRRQLLQQQRTQNPTIPINFNTDIQEPQDAVIKTKFEQLNKRYLVIKDDSTSKNVLTKQEVKQFAKISCTLAGCEAIVQNGKQLLAFLIGQYFYNSAYNESQQLNWVLIALSNLMAVTFTGNQTPNNRINKQKSSASSISNSINTNIINCLATSQKFLERILQIVSCCQKVQIKQNALSSIFCIIYNNQPSFLSSLVTNPKYLIMNVLSNQMYTQPNQTITIEVFRSYYLIVKKLNFQYFQQFSKMRKFIVLGIRNSNSFQISMAGILCLYALLQSTPSQKLHMVKSGILTTIIIQSLSYKNSRFTINVLKIMILILDSKNESKFETQAKIRQILQFIQQLIIGDCGEQQLKYNFKIIYEILVNSLIKADTILSDYPRLTAKMIQLFESNATDKSLMTQLSYDLSMIAAKSYSMSKQLNYKIRTRVQEIVDYWEIDEQSINYLNQALMMLESTEKMGEA